MTKYKMRLDQAPVVFVDSPWPTIGSMFSEMEADGGPYLLRWLGLTVTDTHVEFQVETLSRVHAFSRHVGHMYDSVVVPEAVKRCGWEALGFSGDDAIDTVADALCSFVEEATTKFNLKLEYHEAAPE